MKFLKNNFLYVIWFLLYFLVAWAMFAFTKNGLLIVSLTYAVSISIALSPIGEWILRKFEGVRRPATRQEKEYLEPIFQEVYENALNANPKLSKNIKLHISDEMYTNAFALGRNTIAVTNGAIETFTQEELKGILAHEFGHIAHSHTKALLLSVVGNAIFSLVIISIKFIMSIVELIVVLCSKSAKDAMIRIIVSSIANYILNISIFMFFGLGQLILSLNSRINEYQADNFAKESGYNEELISALYLLQKIACTQKMTLKQKMTASHPHIAMRIERLENMVQ